GRAIWDGHAFPKPAVFAGLDADSGRHEFGGWLFDRRNTLDLDVLFRATKELIERADMFDANPWQRISNEPADSPPCPGESVFLQQHQRFPDHGEADVHHDADSG